MKNIKNLHKKFCEFPPRLLQTKYVSLFHILTVNVEGFPKYHLYLNLMQNLKPFIKSNYCDICGINIVCSNITRAI